MKMKEALKELSVTRRIPVSSLMVFCVTFLAGAVVFPRQYGESPWGWLDAIVLLSALVVFELTSVYSCYFKVLYTDSKLAFYERSIWLCVDSLYPKEHTFHVAPLNVFTYWQCRLFPDDFRKRLLWGHPRFSRLVGVEERVIKIPESALPVIEKEEQIGLVALAVDELYFSIKIRELNPGIAADGGVILRLAREEHARKKTFRPLI